MQVRVAAIQMAISEERSANIAKAEHWVRQAAAAGANIILLQELFSTPYFCKDQNIDFFALARPRTDDPALLRMQALAAELAVVLPVSFFERAGNAYFNSLVTFDADGRDLGLYRKAHIPDGPGYQEKFYFSPGDTGFQVFSTRYGRLGVAICWDQWFPETARILALQGAEILLYPTAIGSEPMAPEIHSRDHWTRTMQGHAAANVMPVIAANRVGREDGESASITFYGGSFITDGTGALLAQADLKEGFIHADLDLQAIARQRIDWGLFRDRRPDLYAPICSFDGQTGN
ncbi:N-carbamoylputrescine amidase [Acidithiobacillus sp. AMEEHan]|uniref:N-carbamoylputrescine amidase n=1 Tax=Acidithiobacillus sp. AMEEHan TaxID=2994951 RepID=UPI0027E441C2|nr:N-carbamoylputrescine amidase [Acidithiobacillus sp. AMEEHan]